MITIEEFRDKVIRKCLSNDESNVVFLRPNLSIAIDKAKAEEVKELFIEGMKQIPDIDKGLSYIRMAGNTEFWLEQRDALICQAIGKVLGVWQLFPSEDMQELFSADPIGMFPMNTGLKESV